MTTMELRRSARVMIAVALDIFSVALGIFWFVAKNLRRQLRWAGAAVGLLTIAILIGYRYDITLWDWIKLLVVPAVIAAGGLWFNVQQREREQRIANERAQDEALQGYLDGMSQLLTDKEQPLHKSQPSDNLSTVARARTLTVLTRLDRSRKRSVLQFLYESRLIDQERALLNESDLIERRHNMVSLRGADLSEADLNGANLNGANLIVADLSEADLSHANLSGANLSEADLSHADLSGADLSGANLSGANLGEATLTGGADLNGANLNGANLIVADLTYADLSGATLSGADLSGAFLTLAKLSGAFLSGAFLTGADLSSANLDAAYLSEADLTYADLSGAKLQGAHGWTEEQLTAARDLKEATMPDGQVLKGASNSNGPSFEDWLKSKGRREDEENG